MKRRAFLQAGALGSATAIAGCLGVGGRRSSDGPPRLSVDGQWLTDPDGNRIVLRGVNVVDPWWGVEYADLRGKDYWETLELAVDRDAGWHSHVLRIPVEPRTIEAIGYETLLDEYLDRAVELAREAGVYAIIDFHEVGRYDTVDVDERVREFWSAVAPRYADDAHVLYELFNEPTKPGQNGLASWRNWREVATPWVELVRREAPETPIIVGSPQWSSMPRFAAQAPFEDDNVVYAAHIFPSWEPETWEPRFGSPALDVPVFVTEWGYINVRGEHTEPHMIGSTSGYGEPFREWLSRHENVSWCAWTFDSEWMPPMWDKEWNLLEGEDYMGGFTKEWLADEQDSYWPPGREESTGTPTAGEPPSAPSNLRATERGTTSIDVAWDRSTDPDGDDVVQYRVGIDGSTTQVLQGTATAATLEDLSPGEEYLVSVRAVDATGLSSEAASISVSTLDATEPVATIPRTEVAPTIDGTAGDAWDGVPAHAVENVLMEPPGDHDELAAEWMAVWDAEAIYYHVTVTDPEATVDSDLAYQDDNVEVYLDPDYSRESSYDEENDAQLLVRRDDDTIRPGANSVAYGDATAATTETEDGWAVEFAIPWSDTGVEPEPGMKLGTDVHATDDVDGGDRDAKIGWFSTNDDSWQRPDTFATAVLGE